MISSLFIEDIESQFSKKDKVTKVSGKDGVILVGVGTKGKGGSTFQY